MLKRIKNWISSLGKQDPEEVIPATFTIEGMEEKTSMTARQANDLTEVMFGERWYKTEKK